MKYALVLNAPNIDLEIKEKYIVAADGGYRHVEDRAVQAVIGDFDTLGYVPEFVTTVSHPTDKDQTDGEICLDYLKSVGATEVNIYGATGGHVDHVLGNVNLLAYADSIGINAKIVDVDVEIYFVKGNFSLTTEVGNIFSIFPFGGQCSFVSSYGLKYSLDGLTLKPHLSLGISNEVTKGKVEINVKNGNAIAIIRKKTQEK